MKRSLQFPVRVLRTLAMPALLSLAGCATNPADDPVQQRLNDVDARIGKVERVISNQSLVDLSRRLDTLEAQQRELRGNGELLQNASDGLRKQQRDLYADLDRRISALEGNWRTGAGAGAGSGGGGASGAPASGTLAGGAAAGAAGTAASGGGTPAGEPAAPGGAAPSEEQLAYGRAFDQLKSGDYAGAIKGFGQVMKDYPQGSLGDNAQYWIGEAYYVTRDFDQAEAAFRALGDRWPGSRKAPDALLKLGYTQIEQKHPSEARVTLGQVVQRFPGSDASRLAAEKLSKLTAESH
jgi:tol-pal system protein YbgF